MRANGQSLFCFFPGRLLDGSLRGGCGLACLLFLFLAHNLGSALHSAGMGVLFDGLFRLGLRFDRGFGLLLAGLFFSLGLGLALPGLFLLEAAARSLRRRLLRRLTPGSGLPPASQ